MNYRRYNLDLAFKLPLEPGLQGQLTAFEATIHNILRHSAVKINEGQDSEEDTTKATWHICHHDSGNTIPCEGENEI